jgi:hypothetical protein
MIMLATTKITAIAGAAALLLGASYASTPAFAGGGDRFECKTESLTEDASMDARFEVKRGRMKFDASFEAAPGGPAGSLAVLIDGTKVDSMEVLPDATGELTGDVSYDSEPDENAPFPNDFPQNVGAGTAVVVGVLGCTLRG